MPSHACRPSRPKIMSDAITVTLPDGKQLDLAHGATVLDVAAKVGPGLATAAPASNGVRAEVDDRSETLGLRIREGQTEKIPLTLVIGDEEVERGTVSPRLRKSKQANDAMSAEALALANGERRKAPLD